MAAPFLLLMPSYNQSHYIADAVRSILAQDDPNWELWIVDNSSDATPEIMREFADPRIHFHHVLERMDPGSCLNWMLGRADGDQFSYVHTDNNLDVSYVRRMRTALSGHRLGLAYCNLRTIDDNGRRIGIFLRGEFGLARLFSMDTLGVPFAATVELAKVLGGFSVGDYADDVRFCISAFGLAEYIYVREPLLDYRLHSGSRTEEAGGERKMQRIFIDLMPQILPIVEDRGLHPIQAMEQAIREALDDMDIFVEDYWYRRVSGRVATWWHGYPGMHALFLDGMLDLPGFSGSDGRPARQLFIRRNDGQVHPWSTFRARRLLRKCGRQLRQMARRPMSMLLPWACMKLGVSSETRVAIRVASLDVRTLWAARQLEIALGWTPLLDRAMLPVPGWLAWGVANGNEPLLDCSAGVRLTMAGA